MKLLRNKLRQQTRLKLQKKLGLNKGKAKYSTPHLLTELDAATVLRTINSSKAPSPHIKDAVVAFRKVEQL